MKSNTGELDIQELMPMVESGIKNMSKRPRLHGRLDLVVGVFFLSGLILILMQTSASYLNLEEMKNKFDDNKDKKSLFGASGVYKGKTWVSSQTVSKEIIAETKFARCDMHTVRLEDGTLIKDWLFFEERSAINVIVINRKGQFVMFKQTKYALEGETFSPVGGFIDDGETPIQAAKREVKEELGLASRASLNTQSTNDAQSINDPDWVSLGSYRTAVNRGAGYTHLFLLKEAVPVLPKGGTAYFNGSGDSESQKIHFLSKNQVLDAMSKAQFQEIKWTAALSLSLLHLENKMPAITNTPLL